MERTTLQQVSEILGATVDRVPYSNFTKLYLAEGLPIPDEYGGNCIEVTRRLVRALADIDGENAYLVAHVANYDKEHDEEYYEETYHHALIKKIDGEWYFMDPIIVLNQPIPVERILAKPREFGESGYTFDAKPIVNGKPTHVIIKPIDNTTFMIRVESPKKHGYKVIAERYYFLDEAKTEIPQSDDLNIAVADADSYYVRFLNDDGGRILVAFDADVCETVLSVNGDRTGWHTWVLEKTPEKFMQELWYNLPLDVDPQDLLNKLWFCPTIHERLKRSWHAKSGEVRV